MTACAPEPAPNPADANTTDSEPPAATQTGRVEYRCDDGSRLQVDYSRDAAQVLLRDGNRMQLRKTESASKGPGTVYISDTRSLFRGSEHVQWQGPAGEPLTCMTSPPTQS